MGQRRQKAAQKKSAALARRSRVFVESLEQRVLLSSSLGLDPVNLPIVVTGSILSNSLATAPAVVSITRATPAGPQTEASSVTYDVTFNELVTGVGVGAFSVATTGSVAASIGLVVSPSPTAWSSSYSVTVNGITGVGTLGVTLINATGIKDVDGDQLALPIASQYSATEQTYATGQDPHQVALADLTGDGKLDMVVTNYNDNTVSVFMGNGDGTFQSPATFPAGNEPGQISIADANQDGKPDLIIGDWGGDSVAILYGNGDGTFQAPLLLNAGAPVGQVYVGDINGDGIPDIVADTNTINEAVVAFMGIGSGAFGPVQTLAATVFDAPPSSFAMADLTGNGKLDLILGNGGDNNHLSFYLGNGDGTFAFSQSFTTDPSPSFISVADVNGDHIPDLVVTNQLSDTVSVLLGNGNGTFQQQKKYATGDAPIDTVAGDFNGDGNIDLAVADYPDEAISVLLGNGDGTFQSQGYISVGTDPIGIAAGVLIPGGLLDLAVANSGSNSVSVLLSQPGSAAVGPLYNIDDPAGLNYTQNPLTTSVGQTINPSTGIQLAVEDINGNTVGIDNSPVTLTLNNGGTFVSTGTSSVTVNAVNGIATFNNLAVNTPGTFSVTASDGNLTVATSTLIVTAATKLAFVAVPASGDVYTALSPGVQIAIEDASGNIVTGGPGVPITLTWSSGEQFQNDTPITVTTVNGIATFTTILANSFGSFSLIADAGNLTPATSAPISIFAALSVNLPSSGFAGQTFANRGTVSFADSAVATDSVVNLVSSDPTEVSVPATVIIPAGNSFAYFTVTLMDENQERGTQNVTITASSPELTSGGGTIAVHDAALAGLAFTPITGRVNMNAPFPVTVSALNVVGEGIPDYSGTVTLSGSITGGASVSVSPTTVTLASGVWTGNVTIGASNPSITLQASTAGGITASSNAFAVIGPVPFIASITRGSPAGDATDGSSVTYNVTFNVPVTGVNAKDFDLVTTGTVSANTVLIASPSSSSLSTVWTVTVNGISGAGSLWIYSPPHNLQTGAGHITDQYGQSLTIPSTPLLQAQQTYAVGSSPEQTALADLTGNGILDLIVTNASSNTVSVLMGNGDGTFQAAKNYAAGTTPNNLAVADVNGDGKPDLIIGDSKTVSVLIGNGDGTFKSPVTLTPAAVDGAAVSVRNVHVADINGDGKPDILVGTPASLSNLSSVQVFLGNGGGTFQSPQILLSGINAVSFTMADVNGDGTLDLLVGSAATGSVYVALGNGNGTYQTAQSYLFGTTVPGTYFPYAIVATDANGDGHADLIITNSQGGNGLILLGNGDGTFQTPAVSFTTSGGADLGLVAGDFTGDGIADLAFANNAKGTISIDRSYGSDDNFPPFYMSPLNYTVGTSPVGIAEGDLNGDGVLDLAVANNGSNTVSVLLGQRLPAVGQTYFINQPTQPPALLGMTINDGSAQRSMIDSLTLTFSQQVTLASGAIGLTQQGGPAISLLIANPSGDQQTFVVTFTGPQIIGASLADGQYNLVVNNALVQNADGLTPTGANPTFNFFRLFGSVDGSTSLDATDIAAFAAAQNSVSTSPNFVWYFDFDGNGTIDGLDALHFRQQQGLIE